MQHTTLQMDNSSAAPHSEPRSLQSQYVQHVSSFMDFTIQTENVSRKSKFRLRDTRECRISSRKGPYHHHHHHHHHVHEGLGVFPVPWSSKWSWSLHLFFGHPMVLRPFGLYCSACFGILFVSILCTCCSHFFWCCFISFNMFCAPVFSLIHWFFSLSNFVIPSKCLKIFICAASKRCSSLLFSTQASLPNFNAALAGRDLQRRKSKWEGLVDVTVHSGECQRALTVSNWGLLLQVEMSPGGGVRKERKAVA